MNSGFYALMIAAAALWGGREALAVNPGEVSQSAEAVCVFRAIAAQHPDPKLRNPDDLAGGLCGSPWMRWTAWLSNRNPPHRL